MKTKYLPPAQPRGHQNRLQLVADGQQAVIRPIQNQTKRLLTKPYLAAPPQVRYKFPVNHARLSNQQSVHHVPAGMQMQTAYLQPPPNAPSDIGLM